MNLKQLRIIKVTIILCLLVYGAINAHGLVLLLAALIGYFELRHLASEFNISKHDSELSPLNNLLTHTDKRTVEQLMDFGLWEYDLESKVFTLSPKCRDYLMLDNEYMHINLDVLAEQVHEDDRIGFEQCFSELDKDVGLFIEFRSIRPSDYSHWLRLEGDPNTHGNGQRILAGRLVEATEKVLVKRIQKEMSELLTDVIEHKQAIDTLCTICDTVTQIEPAINCVIFLSTANSDAPQVIHNNQTSEAFHSILEKVTLLDEQSEYVYTTETKEPVYIDDLYSLAAWQSLGGLDFKEHIKTYVGQAIFSTDHEMLGVIALYMPNNDLSREVTEIVLSSVYKIASIAIESQLQTDDKDKIQQQLYHSQKMDSIGYLTGGIAHDFNNILGSIVGYNGLARKVATKIDNEQLSGYLNEITIASDRARELIDQMMSYSRAEPVEKRIIEPQTIVKEVIHLVRSIIPSSIEIRSNYSKHLPKIEINPISLHQILLNHLINAKDAFPDFSGLIEINIYPVADVSEVCSSCHKPFFGNYVAIEIRDNGIGISAEIEKKIFAPFFTTKEVGRGSGMGLSVVHSLLHDANSHITIDTAVGEGTTFTLFFPEEQHRDSIITVAEDVISEPDNSPGHGQHIMVIDDDVPLSILMTEILLNHDYNVSRFESGIAALEQFQEAPEAYDLVLTDQTMPLMTGDEMARKMLAIKPDLPILVCTGFSEKLTKSLAKEIGIRSVMKKPVEIPTLLEEIAQYSSQR